MRADRLVAILAMLQTKGRITAAEVAEELEISERTARRDLDALGMAGLPVVSHQGRNGGWELIGGGRTDLSGLTSAEARALFLVAGPSSTATPDVRAALRKLVRALPEPFRPEAEAAAASVVVDPVGWGHTAPRRPPPAHLDVLQDAVITGACVRLGYVARDRASSERVVHPLGLASKGQSWYLVGDTDAGLRTFRVDRVVSVVRTGEPVVRPEGFDLAEAWRMITDTVDQARGGVEVRGVVDPDVVAWLRYEFGNAARIGPAGDDGRVAFEVSGANEVWLAARLAMFGGRVEVREPAAIRRELARIGAALAERYS